MADKKKQLRKLQEQLDALKIFPKNKHVIALQKQITSKIKLLQKPIKLLPSKTDKQKLANESRSVKLKKYHRYIKMIRNNFPNLKHKEIRKQFSKRKKGQDVSIPDAVWQNPSP